MLSARTRVTLRAALLLASSIGLMPRGARAQTASARTASGCDYATCALRIVPRLRGLDVVRGDDELPAGSLDFLWPATSLTRAFDGDGRAQDLARASVRTRRIAAALTAGGVTLLTAALARGVLVKSDPTPSVTLGVAGAAVFAVSIPVQFAADDQLSRAVHMFNRHFAQ